MAKKRQLNLLLSLFLFQFLFFLIGAQIAIIDDLEIAHLEEIREKLDGISTAISSIPDQLGHLYNVRNLLHLVDVKLKNSENVMKRELKEIKQELIQEMHQVKTDLQNERNNKLNEIFGHELPSTADLLNATRGTNKKLVAIETLLTEWIEESLFQSLRQEGEITKIINDSMEHNNQITQKLSEQLTTTKGQIQSLQTEMQEGVENIGTAIARGIFRKWRNCKDLFDHGFKVSGIYDIYVSSSPNSMKSVYCDMETDGGGWTLIQKRGEYPHQRNFNLGWNSYVEGFGNLNEEFWLGLETIYEMTNQQPCEARFDMEDWDGNKAYAQYNHFSLGDSSSNYVLHISGVSGNAGDSIAWYHGGSPFSTFDRDNDKKSANCAQNYKGGWWYKSCLATNLNGLYLRGSYSDSYDHGIVWAAWKGGFYSLKTTEIKIRPNRAN